MFAWRNAYDCYLNILITTINTLIRITKFQKSTNALRNEYNL